MWWFRIGLLCLVAACGFEPAGQSIQGRFTVAEPTDRASFLLVQRIEERIGRAIAADYVLDVELTFSEQGLAIDREGDVRRFNLIGTAAFTVTNAQTGDVLDSGTLRNFTGYSATGSTVSTLAAERDAQRRLSVILADQVVARLQTLSVP